MSSPVPEGRDALVAAILRATTDLAAARVAYAQGVAERQGLAGTDVEVLRLLGRVMKCVLTRWIILAGRY